MQRLRVLPLVLVMVCVAAGRAPANEIYDKLAPSTVLMLYQMPNEVMFCSGVLIDAEKKLVLTCEHCVHHAIRDGSFKTTVMFPSRDRDGTINTNAVYYSKHYVQNSIPGEIVYFDRTKDIALIRLERLPSGVRAVPLAAADVKPGDRIHGVGNATYALGGSFGYYTGTVRNDFFMAFTTRPSPLAANLNDSLNWLYFSMCSDAPANRGDSGGPQVNSKGELVSIMSMLGSFRAPGIQLISSGIHVREIRRALEGIQQPSGSTLEVTANFSTRDTDYYFLPMSKSTKLTATLKGNGSTDLDLFVKDIDSTSDWPSPPGDTQKWLDFAKVMSSTGLTDQENVAGTVDVGGTALVQVQNLGGKSTNNNQYTLSVNWTHPTNSPFTFIRSVASKGSDTIKLPYEAGKGKARVTVRPFFLPFAESDTISMEVLDPNGKSVARSKAPMGSGYHTMNSLTFDPAVSGVYTVRIDNARADLSLYGFTTD